MPSSRTCAAATTTRHRCPRRRPTRRRRVRRTHRSDLTHPGPPDRQRGSRSANATEPQEGDLDQVGGRLAPVLEPAVGALRQVAVLLDQLVAEVPVPGGALAPEPGEYSVLAEEVVVIGRWRFGLPVPRWWAELSRRAQGQRGLGGQVEVSARLTQPASRWSKASRTSSEVSAWVKFGAADVRPEATMSKSSRT